MKTAFKDMQKVTMQERAKVVLQMREDNKTFDDIAAALGITRQTAISDRNRALAALAAETQVAASSYRTLNTARLESILAAHEDKAVAGDSKSTELYLKTLDQLNRLYGLYPTNDNAAAGERTTINISYTNDNRQITISRPAAEALPAGENDTDTDTPMLVTSYASRQEQTA